MVKNLLWLACRFDLDQSERKSSQVNASACKAWPNRVASRPKFSTCNYLRDRLARALVRTRTTQAKAQAQQKILRVLCLQLSAFSLDIHSKHKHKHLKRNSGCILFYYIEKVWNCKWDNYIFIVCMPTCFCLCCWRLLCLCLCRSENQSAQPY